MGISEKERLSRLITVSWVCAFGGGAGALAGRSVGVKHSKQTQCPGIMTDRQVSTQLFYLRHSLGFYFRLFMEPSPFLVYLVWIFVLLIA